MKVYGFTLLRNGIKYDYPFLESISSLSGLCEKVYLALGDNQDATEHALPKTDKLCITPTVWDEQKRKDGLILSEQTNIALAELRKNHASGWAFYLQCDEVLLEQAYPQILNDLRQAEAQGCDSVSFRYLHFWQSYHKIAIGRRCYPHEIRAVRIESNLASSGDAQGFYKPQKTYFSDVPIFHYGHIREPGAYKLKVRDFHRWWHSDDELKAVLAKGEKITSNEVAVAYLGPHPLVMEKRVALEPKPESPIAVEVKGDPKTLSEEFLKSVKTKLLWSNSDLSVKALLSSRSFFQKYNLFSPFYSKVPESMMSPSARPWPPEFLALLRLSERGVSVGRLQ